MEEALRELRAAPDGEGVQLRARVGEEARAVIGDAAAPRDVELVRVKVRVRVGARVRVGVSEWLPLHTYTNGRGKVP